MQGKSEMDDEGYEILKKIGRDGYQEPVKR